MWSEIVLKQTYVIVGNCINNEGSAVDLWPIIFTKLWGLYVLEIKVLNWTHIQESNAKNSVNVPTERKSLGHVCKSICLVSKHFLRVASHDKFCENIINNYSVEIYDDQHARIYFAIYLLQFIRDILEDPKWVSDQVQMQSQPTFSWIIFEDQNVFENERYFMVFMSCWSDVRNTSSQSRII